MMTDISPVEAHSESNKEGLIVRQPVFNQQLKIVSYQLRYEQDLEPGNALLMDHPSTATMLLNTFASLCQDGKVHRVPLFLPFCARLLMDKNLPVLPERQLLIEIPATTRVTRPLLKRLSQLKKRGFRIVLDGFSLQKALFPLLPLASIIKVDMQTLPKKKLVHAIRILKRLPGTLMAQNIDDFHTLQVCKKVGFKLFQGTFISKPSALGHVDIPTHSAALMQLIQALQSPDISTEDAGNLVMMDPVLSFKILRVINSAAYNLPNDVSSLQQAVALLGLDQIRGWAMIIMLSNQEGRPEEWSRNLIARARMCELLAELNQSAKPEAAFLVGLLSQLDLILEAELDLILNQIALDQTIREAVLEHKGALGSILRAVTHFERGHWREVKRSGIPEMLFKPAYRHSINWTENAMQALHENLHPVPDH